MASFPSFLHARAGAIGKRASCSAAMPAGTIQVSFARFLVALVRAYQIVVSPWLGRSCRFEPSCSRYAIACLNSHGALRGSLLSVKRLCKCSPFHPGGYDPPPSGKPTERS